MKLETIAHKVLVQSLLLHLCVFVRKGFVCTYSDNHENLDKREIKHEYLRSRAYICLSLSSPFSSSPVIVIQI